MVMDKMHARARYVPALLVFVELAALTSSLPFQGPAGDAHAATDGRALPRRRFAARRDGARLPDRIRRDAAAAGAAHDLL